MNPAEKAPSEYEKARQQRKLAWKARRPDLLFRDDYPKVTGRALAARNARLLLKKAFPGVRFFVRVDAFAGGTSMDVSWWAMEQGPAAQPDFRKQVEAVVGCFAHGRYDFESESYMFHQGEAGGFTEAFGGVGHLALGERTPTPAERARLEARRLNQVLARGRRGTRRPGGRL